MWKRTFQPQPKIASTLLFNVSFNSDLTIDHFLAREREARLFEFAFLSFYTASPEKAEFEVLTFCVRVIHVRG